MYKLINFFSSNLGFPFKGWKYMERFMRTRGLDTRIYRKRLHNGLHINVSPVDHIQKQIFWYGYYEPEIVKFIEKNVSENSVFIDVGANIGYFTLLASKKAASGKIIAFEPVKHLFEQLDTNIELNKLNNVTSVHAAASDQNGSTKVYLAGIDNVGMSSLKPPENYSGISEAVSSIRIDDWLSDHEITKVDLIKVDIEGHELSALKGMKGTLTKHKPTLIIEINPSTLAYFNLTPADVFNFMQSLNYNYYSISHENFVFQPK